MSGQFCRLLCGDSAVMMAGLDAESVSACVTDPPYGLSKEPDVAEVMRHWLAGDRYEHGSAGFMQTAWDSFVPGPEYWREVYRLLKPGGYLLAFSSTRTWDLLSMAIRLAGFENRDTISLEGPSALRWYHAEGFPKSLNVGKAIDAAAGADRRVIGPHPNPASTTPRQGMGDGCQPSPMLTGPATDEAKRWDGWGTALKPSWEVVLMFRKPFKSSVASNVLKHGTGALNIARCRIGTNSKAWETPRGGIWQTDPAAGAELIDTGQGRWPANAVFSHADGCRRRGTKRVKGTNLQGANGFRNEQSYGGFPDASKRPPAPHYTDPDGTEAVADWLCVESCPIRLLDAMAGGRSSGAWDGHRNVPKMQEIFNPFGAIRDEVGKPASTGSASRFFTCLPGDGLDTGPGFIYQSKPSQSERSRGLAGRNPGIAVKSLRLMDWLCTLVTPPSGTILDPFMGTGSTGVAALRCGFSFIGCDQDPEMVEISRARMGLLANLDIAEGES